MTPKLESTELGPYLNWFKIGDIWWPRYRRKTEGLQETDLGHQFLLEKNNDQTILVGPNFKEVDLELVHFFIRPGCPNFVVLLGSMILTGY